MSVQPRTFNDTIRTGGVYDVDLVFKDSSNKTINLTGWTVASEIWNEGKTVKYATFSVDSTNAATGNIVLSLTATQTNGLPIGEVYYDVLLTNPSGRKEYYLKGKFYIQQGYTT